MVITQHQIPSLSEDRIRKGANRLFLSFLSLCIIWFSCLTMFYVIVTTVILKQTCLLGRTAIILGLILIALVVFGMLCSDPGIQDRLNIGGKIKRFRRAYLINLIAENNKIKESYVDRRNDHMNDKEKYLKWHKAETDRMDEEHGNADYVILQAGNLLNQL